MAAPYDPNWYLSTVVQSSAALIAIIGGFLVSRLVSLTSQRSEFVQKKSNLNNRRKSALQELSVFKRDQERAARQKHVSRFLGGASKNLLIPEPVPLPDSSLTTEDVKLQKKQDVEHMVKFLDDELSALVKLDEIRPGIIAIIKGFIALSYFGIVGVIYPLFLMTKNPVVVDALSRDIVFFGFVSGFVALLFFIIDLLWNLR